MRGRIHRRDTRHWRYCGGTGSGQVDEGSQARLNAENAESAEKVKISALRAVCGMTPNAAYRDSSLRALREAPES